MENKLEILTQLFEVAMRINLETDMACWVNVSGHVDSFEVRVAKSKEMFQKDLTRHQMYYRRDYMADNGTKEFLETAKEALDDLNNILSARFEHTYTAYCNLIDMSCSQVFTSEAGAKRWVSKMKRKYDKVNAIVGYQTDLKRED